MRAAYRFEDAAVIDLSSAAISEGWTTGSQAELLFLQSMVHTLTTHFDGVDRVKFLVNGGEVSTLGGHIDLSKPLLPDSTLPQPPN